MSNCCDKHQPNNRFYRLCWNTLYNSILFWLDKQMFGFVSRHWCARYIKYWQVLQCSASIEDHWYQHCLYLKTYLKHSLLSKYVLQSMRIKFFRYKKMRIIATVVWCLKKESKRKKLPPIFFSKNIISYCCLKKPDKKGM